MIKLMQRFEATGDVAPDQFRGFKRSLLARREAEIRAWIAECPDETQTIAEQFVVWALREIASNDPRSAERLDRGFRLAFGCCARGLAACGFDGMRRCLAMAERPPALCPLHCACLAIDEELLLAGLGAAQRGNRPLHASLSRRFVGECGALSLWRQSRILGSAMVDAGLILPEGPRLTALPSWAWH